MGYQERPIDLSLCMGLRIQYPVMITVRRSGALRLRKPHPDQLSVPIDDRALPPMHVLVLVENQRATHVPFVWNSAIVQMIV
jgi:hypothetical protein